MITCIHPSRGRPEQAFKTYQNWLSKAVDKNIQWILSLDKDDNTAKKYLELFTDVEINVNYNKNLIQAVNATIPFIKGGLVVVVSDDFDCPDKWDVDLELAWTYEAQKDEYKNDKDVAIYINDGITFGRKCMTLPILSKSLIDKLGYIYYPEYTGMFADDDLYQVCEKLGVIITKDILFQHKHWVNGMAARDATYNRHNTDASWKLGQKTLARRQKENFGL